MRNKKQIHVAGWTLTLAYLGMFSYLALGTEIGYFSAVEIMGFPWIGLLNLSWFEANIIFVIATLLYFPAPIAINALILYFIGKKLEKIFTRNVQK